MNKAASNGHTRPEMTARATSKAAMAAMKAGAKGASIPYEPRRRGLTRSAIRIAFPSRVFLHSDEAAAPHGPTNVSRFSYESIHAPGPWQNLYRAASDFPGYSREGRFEDY